MSRNEELVLAVRYSRFIYLLGIVAQILVTLIVIGITTALLLYTALPAQWVLLSTSIIWVLFVLFPILYKYIHWFYSFVLVTKERLVIVNQVSIVHREVTEVSLENFARVAAETQFWNVFPFGILHFTMREENSEPVSLHYVPHAEDAAKKIADVVTTFQSNT